MRAKRLKVSMSLLEQVLSLPEGACVVDVVKSDFETIELLVVDESFPMVPVGVEIPEVRLELSRVESKWA